MSSKRKWYKVNDLRFATYDPKTGEYSEVKRHDFRVYFTATYVVMVRKLYSIRELLTWSN